MSTRGRVLTYAALLIGAVITLFPYYWMAVMASNTTGDIYASPPKLVLGDQLFHNVGEVFSRIEFFGSLLNTLLVAITTTLAVLFFDSLAAFTFAKYTFPGSKVLFGLLLATFVVPTQLAAIPQFSLMAELGWVGSLKALVAPAAANAFGIFWMWQYISGALPDEILEAARVDGCGFFRTYWQVALPLLGPALAFLGIFTFVNAWNDFLWPLVVLIDSRHITLQLAPAQLNGLYATDYSVVMAGTLVAIVPLLIVFLFGARRFVRNVAAGALKG
ncbi:carbohydrate ABC transporter permease [Streptomyces sp. NPDC056716]|uniref:carbohydrate ABC transporter permease n=1 Tax=unclassified Streptomyces TaxID=2593676 RepID=UPI0036B90486